MAFKKSSSRKCPVCVGFTETKVDEVNRYLEPLLQTIKDTGEVPKGKDPRFQDIAVAIGVAPFSLRFHLTHCLIEREIDEQMMVEFRDMLEALSIAKTEYKETPTLPFATAMTNIHSAVLKMHDMLVGETDPEQAVHFIAETVISHILRQSLAHYAKSTKGLLDQIVPYLPPTHIRQVTTAFKTNVATTSNALQEAAGEALDNVCNYYKVEMDVASKKKAMQGTVLPKDDDPVDKKKHA